jgi:hypothetical protein
MADVTEIDYTTNPPTVIERDFTEAELAQQAKDLAAEEARKVALAAKAQARKDLLDKLGLTEEEAGLLLG